MFKKLNALFFTLVIGLSMLSYVNAIPLLFEASLTPLKNKVAFNESAVFDLLIKNIGESSDSYNIRLADGFWSITSQPLYAYQTEYGTDVKASETAHVTLYLKPLVTLNSGTYSIPLEIISKKTGDIIKLSAIVTLGPGTDQLSLLEYKPTVQVDVQLPNQGLLDPRQSATIYIKLDNQNPLNISAVNIAVRSILLNQDIATSLNPLEQKTEQFTVTFQPDQAPLKDMLTVTVTRGDETLKVVKKNYDIIAYSTISREESSKELYAGLWQETKLKLTNVGNIARKETVSIPVSSFAKPFSKATGSYVLQKTSSEGGTGGTKIGDYAYTWSFELKPGQSVTVAASTNYFPVILLLVIIIVGIAAYYIFRSPLIIMKEAYISYKGEADVSEMKVLLFIRNRSGKALTNVRVMDKIPHIAELKDEIIIGTIRPLRVQQAKNKDAIVEWVIPTIEPYEERIISYKIRSKLNIIGLFNLPPSILKFRNRGDKDSVAISNSIKATQKH